VIVIAIAVAMIARRKREIQGISQDRRNRGHGLKDLIYHDERIKIWSSMHE